MRDRKRGGRLVYSTELGRTCPDCRQPLAECRCAANRPAPGHSGPVVVGRETRGRKGSGVTVISGLPLDGAALAELARELKKHLGSGGTVRDDRIEIQGDKRDRIVQELSKRGFDVRRSGG